MMVKLEKIVKPGTDYFGERECYERYIDPVSKHQVFYFPQAEPKDLPISIIIPQVGKKKGVTVTARDMDRYHADLRKIVEDHNQDFQYLEVGVGLGEPITRLGGLRNKPIAVEPLNYRLTKDIIGTMRYKISQIHVSLIKELERRCQFMLSSEVRLFNTTLGAAVGRKEFHGIADLVVDNLGPVHWNETEGLFENPYRLQKRLGNIAAAEVNFLKEEGRLYYDRFSDPYIKPQQK